MAARYARVPGVVCTIFQLAVISRAFSSRRLSGGRVAGRRIDRASTIKPTTTHISTEERQDPSATIAAPALGATIGTSRTIAMMFDIWRAISSPSKASRIMAVTATRGPAAPRLCPA
jgi:hypothetical protein